MPGDDIDDVDAGQQVLDEAGGNHLPSLATPGRRRWPGAAGISAKTPRYSRAQVATCADGMAAAMPVPWPMSQPISSKRPGLRR